MSIKIHSDDILMSYNETENPETWATEGTCKVCGYTETVLDNYVDWEHTLTDCLRELHANFSDHMTYKHPMT